MFFDFWNLLFFFDFLDFSISGFSLLPTSVLFSTMASRGPTSGGPELDHIFGPSAGLCFGPVFGIPDLDPKVGGQPSENLLLPAEVLQADLRRTSMSVVNAFSICVPLCFLYSRGLFLAACFY